MVQIGAVRLVFQAAKKNEAFFIFKKKTSKVMKAFLMQR